MRILLKATNLQLTPALETYVEQKIGELRRFVQSIHRSTVSEQQGRDPVEVRVEIGKPSRHHKHGNVFLAEATVALPGTSLRAEAMREDLRVAIDEVRNELKREFKRYKDRMRTRSRRGARSAKARATLSPDL